MGGWVDLVFGFMLNKQQQLPIIMVVIVVGAAASAAIIFFLQIINNKKRQQQQGSARWKQDIRSNNKRDLELNHPLCHSTDDKNQSAKSCLLNIIQEKKHTKDLVLVIGSEPSYKTAVTSPESGGDEASNGTQAGNETQSPSQPHFKVRKEKLGDRITALQQLVSPFGKADTASVLLETIGYIKFLHEMVHNLSTDDEEAGPKGPKRDLRSRGLCLVPSTYAVTAS